MLTALTSIALVTWVAPAMASAQEALPFRGDFVVDPQAEVISSSRWGPPGDNQHYPVDRDVLVSIDRDADGTADAAYGTHSDATGNWTLELSGLEDLQPGQVIRTDTAVDDLGVEDTADGYHVVYALTIDGWDVDSDTIWGSSDRQSGLQVCVGKDQMHYCMNQWFPEGDTDPWEGDLGWMYQYPDGYIVPGASIGAVQLGDAASGDNGMTSINASIPSDLHPEVWMWPTAGLWDGINVGVSVNGFEPGANVWITINSRTDPTGTWQQLADINVSEQGGWGLQVQVPRYINGQFDCAPDRCMLVAAQMDDPFNVNAVVDLTFARLDLFRWTPTDPAEPWASGTPGDPITGPADIVEHGDFIWVEGSGFTPNQQYQLNQCRFMFEPQCRNTWFAMPWAYTDESGSFGTVLEVGKVMYGPWGSTPTWYVNPTWDLRDGDTVMVNATGLPGAYWEDWPLSYVGAIPTGGWDGQVHIRSTELQFSPDPVRVEVSVSQALEQQLEAIVHVAPLPQTTRIVDWDRETGDLEYGYTSLNRWVQPPEGEVWDPPPPENGSYDCADVLPYDTATSGAQEAVHCSMYFRVTETVVDTGRTVEAFSEWTPIHFARFDLTATTTSATLTSKPAGVTLRGQVTCTGFVPEQYLVNIEGVLTQTTGGKRPSTVSVPFVATATCSGTMSNPGTAIWTVFVPGTFKAGTATVTLDVRSPGFTRNDDPYHVVQTVTIVAPPKGGKR
ncbi:MAG: hypothetical protein MUE78_00440 [Ilumatobacteraceae bacterium]|nr:hypothetical protein [Ilumatobacteraceae bacterium]